MSSAFHSLTLGSNTRRKAPNAPAHGQRDAKRQKIKTTAKETTSAHAADKERALPPDLDFFGTSKASSSKRPDQPVNDQDSDEDASEASGSGGSSSSDDDDEGEDEPAPPPQKITISAPTARLLPSSFHSFLELLSHPLPARPLTEHTRKLLARNLRRHGMRTMWGVQGATSGAMLGLGLGRDESVDVVCVAPTGSGKTLAYLLPMLMQLGRPARSLRADGVEEGQGIRSIVVLPTHELATQIYQEALKLAMPSRGRAEGKGKGKGKGKEDHWRIIMLEKSTEAAVISSASSSDEGALGIDVLVTTPERLHALVEAEKVALERTRLLVLDEADRLLSHEFKDQTNPILGAMTHPHLQKALLSATMEAGPEALARTHLRDGGVRVVVGTKDAASKTVDQKLVFCGSEQGKLLALRQLVASGELPPPTLLFVQSIERANQLYRQLLIEGNLEVGVVHSSLTRKAREDAVRDFKNGKIWVLVVTELMARGLDFKGVEVVVNYDFPQTVQSYVHRIGRTGRGGRKGKAITFFTLEDGPYLRTIANVMRASGCVVEPWMLELPKPSKNLKKDRRKAPLKRKDVGGGDAERLGRKQAGHKRDMVQASKKKKLRDGKAEQAGKAPKSSAMEVDLSE